MRLALEKLVDDLRAAQVVDSDDDNAARATAQKSLHAVTLYLMKEGVPVHLCAPLQHLFMALADASAGRSNDLLEPKPMTDRASTKPVHEALQWATAAAAITVLMDDAGRTLKDAVRAAAAAAGTDQAKLREFRKNVMKGRCAPDTRQHYDWTIREIRRRSSGLGHSRHNLATIALTVVKDQAAA